jgi:hypothetical protein
VWHLRYLNSFGELVELESGYVDELHAIQRVLIDEGILSFRLFFKRKG